MGVDEKYGEVSTERGTIAADEPVIVFRAQDPLAYLVVRAYLGLCIAAGCDEEHLAAVKAAAHRIRDWQEAHPERVKARPDTVQA